LLLLPAVQGIDDAAVTVAAAAAVNDDVAADAAELAGQLMLVNRPAHHSS
jgi:hypothetical protein